MKKVLRYQVPIGGAINEVELPMMGKIVQVGPSTSGPVVNFWVEVDSEEVTGMRKFATIKTGGEIPPGWEFVGSALWPGMLSIHLYEFTGLKN